MLKVDVQWDRGDTPAPAAIALGNFDGVHRGHQVVISAADLVATARGLVHGVATFRPHPRRFFDPNAAPFRLQSEREQDRVLASLGITARYAIPFQRAVSEMTPEAFARDVLVAGVGARHVAIGEDFRFGHKRSGDAALLADLGAALGFSVDICQVVSDAASVRYSSTAIRTALAEGRPREATEALGRPFVVDAIVSRGDQRGRTIGFPTANMALGSLVRPRFGVYAVRAQIDGEDKWMDGVANLGTRPTFDGEEARLETHLLDRQIDLYGRYLRVALLDFIRPEQRFDSLDALKRQITADSEAARSILSQIA